MVKEQLLKDIKSVDNPQLLNQLFGFLRSAQNISVGNPERVQHFAGILSNNVARRIEKNINETFNATKGEW